MSKTSDLTINVSAKTTEASSHLQNISSQIDQIITKQNNLTSKADGVAATKFRQRHTTHLRFDYDALVVS